MKFQISDCGCFSQVYEINWDVAGTAQVWGQTAAHVMQSELTCDSKSAIVIHKRT